MNSKTRVEDLFETIDAFVLDNPGVLEGDFVDSVRSFYHERGYVTDNQKRALENIVTKFRMEES